MNNEAFNSIRFIFLKLEFKIPMDVILKIAEKSFCS